MKTTMYYCKECKGFIDDRTFYFCQWDCVNDGEHIKKRPKGSVEVQEFEMTLTSFYDYEEAK